MKFWRFLFFATCLTSILAAEVVTEFDGETWHTRGDEATRSKSIAENGHCLLADAQVKMKQAAAVISHLGTLQHHPIRLALRGEEGRGGTLDAFPVDAAAPNRVVIVTCDPKGIDVGGMMVGVPGPEVFETGRMSVDFEGVEAFLSVVKAGVKRAAEAGELPTVWLHVRSETSWGQMVRVLQLVRAAGCRFGIVKIDDEFPGLDFEVKMDPNVKPPISKEMDPSKISRIVVNLHDDGELSDEERKPIANDEELKEYVRRERERADISGKHAKLWLRGSKDAVFKGSRRVIRAAAEAGVDQVVFAVYDRKESRSPAKPEEGSQPPPAVPRER